MHRNAIKLLYFHSALPGNTYMDRSTFAKRVLDYYGSLKLPEKLHGGVVVMNPYQSPEIKDYVRQFLFKFFSDNRKRVLVFGINPGRFGAGITGITFTDPVALEIFCGISNTLPKRREVSSEFVYDFAQRWGGPARLYKDFFLTAVSPLGFMKNGVNFNYYDHPAFLEMIKPFLVESIRSQLALGGSNKAAIVLGSGKNKAVFEELNREYKFFKTVYVLEHPRFIMQYRQRILEKYLQKYHQVFTQALTHGVY
jgi:hypothetical protein